MCRNLQNWINFRSSSHYMTFQHFEHIMALSAGLIAKFDDESVHAKLKRLDDD